MKKPSNYKYYSNKKNGVPFKDWPQECKDYKNWKRDIFRHPEWKELSDEEYLLAKKESKRQRGINATKLMRNRYQNMSSEQKVEVNKKKGSHYNNMSDEEKNKYNEILRQRSQTFWDNMTNEQRKEFSQYRWNLKSDEEKESIIRRFNQAGINRMKELSKEEIDKQIKAMNKARLIKLEENAEFREKQINLLRKHNKEYISNLDRDSRIRVLKDNKFNKKFEDRFRNSIMYKEFYFVKELMIEIDGSLKFWDYAIYNRMNDKLVMVIDLDGSFYHGDNSDYNGLHSREDRDEKRGYFVPEGVKVQIITEENFGTEFREMMNILIVGYDEYVNNIFKSLRSIEFPYPKYHHNELISSFNQLFRLDPCNRYLSLSTRNREGDRIINNFHHSIYHAHVRNKVSPYNAWNNDELLRKCIINRTIYRSILDPNKILQGFNVSKIAPKVSVFSAGRAKLLIYKYLNKFNEIFDPFSGFSGRMLGTMSMNKHYIGQDISPIHISESKNIVDFIERCKINFPNVIIPSMSCKDVNDSYGEYECLFTCPPYGMKEIWQREICSNNLCDDWIDICLSHFKCKRYLFVVDKTERYLEYVIDVIINKSHFGKSYEYIIMIDRD